nr:HNH endonuclease [Kineosphaera limosa]
MPEGSSVDRSESGGESGGEPSEVRGVVMGPSGESTADRGPANGVGLGDDGGGEAKAGEPCPGVSGEGDVDDFREFPEGFTVAQASAELQELEARSACQEVRRAALLGWMVQQQTLIDVQRWQIDNATEDEPCASSLAAMQAKARTSIVDTATTVCGGFRGVWVDRARVGTAPEPLATTLTAAVAEGAVTMPQASRLLKEASELDITVGQREFLIDQVVEHARGYRATRGIPVSQGLFRTRVRRAVWGVAGPAKQEKAVHERREVRLFHLDDRAGGLEVTGPETRVVAAMTRLDAIAKSAKAAGDQRTLAQLRADAALDLMIFGHPGQDAATSIDVPQEGGWPPAVINVVVSAASLLGANDVPGLVEDALVGAHVVRDLAYARGSVWRRIVADPVTGYAMNATVDSYRPTADMARVVRARDGQCRAPGCTRPAAHAELDHVHERRDGGPTKGTNLQDLCAGHHRAKSRRHWSAHMDDTGVVSWRLTDGTITSTYPMDYRDFGIHDTTSRDSPDSPDSTNSTNSTDNRAHHGPDDRAHRDGGRDVPGANVGADGPSGARRSPIDRPPGDRAHGERTQGERTQGDRAQGDRAQGDRAQGERTQGDGAQEVDPHDDPVAAYRAGLELDLQLELTQDNERLREQNESLRSQLDAANKYLSENLPF